MGALHVSLHTHMLELPLQASKGGRAGGHVAAELYMRRSSSTEIWTHIWSPANVFEDREPLRRTLPQGVAKELYLVVSPQMCGPHTFVHVSISDWFLVNMPPLDPW